MSHRAESNDARTTRSEERDRLHNLSLSKRKQRPAIWKQNKEVERAENEMKLHQLLKDAEDEAAMSDAIESVKELTPLRGNKKRSMPTNLKPPPLAEAAKRSPLTPLSGNKKRRMPNLKPPLATALTFENPNSINSISDPEHKKCDGGSDGSDLRKDSSTIRKTRYVLLVESLIVSNFVAHNL